MGFWSFFTLLCLIGFYVNWYGTTKALRLNANISEGGSKLPSLPSYYGTHSFFGYIPVISFIIWFFLNHVMDFFLNNYISSNLDDSFTGTLYVDRYCKGNKPDKVFPEQTSLVERHNITDNCI